MTMNKKVFYVAPAINEVEFVQEGVLCSSDRNGTVDPMTDGPDFSDMWGQN